MKPRTVIVTLELETDAPLKELRDKEAWKDAVGCVALGVKVRQVTATVSQPATRRPTEVELI